MCRGPLVSVKAHPEIVWSRPDMGIGMVANPVAFGVGNPPALIRWRDVEHSLLKGYLPIVTARYEDGDLRYEQVLYATLLDGGEVKTGHEKQVVMIRMSVVNTSPTGLAPRNMVGLCACSGSHERRTAVFLELQAVRCDRFAARAVGAFSPIPR